MKWRDECATCMKCDTNNILIAPHFNLVEFECPCCARVIINKKGIEKLEKLRAETQRPIVITSGYRCSRHNREVKGHPFSLHQEGRAYDIAANTENTLKVSIKKLFAGSYYNKDRKYWHVQLDPVKEW